MSKQPDEIEEGEIEYSEEEEGSILEMDEEVDIPNLLGSLFATENGDTVCSALLDISTHMQVQNKILVKILAQLQSMKSN